MKIKKEELENQIRDIVSKIIEVDSKEIKKDTNFAEDLGADSMMALEIMATLEKRYKISISEDQLAKLTSLTNITELVSSLLPDTRE